MIVGSTGSGKSVLVENLICTALFRFPGDSENSANFVFIDPKGIEFSKFNQLPHTITYASSSNEILSSLNQTLSIAESRLQKISRNGGKEYFGSDIYLFIDDFSILTYKNAISTISRILQIGRPTKVHTILL